MTRCSITAFVNWRRLTRLAALPPTAQSDLSSTSHNWGSVTVIAGFAGYSQRFCKLMRYNRVMRRLLAILLLLIPGLPLVSPLIVAAAGQDASLPACCRRNGAHHCSAMMSADAGSSAATRIQALRERCPSYPAAAVSVFHGDTAAITSALFLHVHPELESSSFDRSASVSSRIDRTKHDRGPPSSIIQPSV